MAKPFVANEGVPGIGTLTHVRWSSWNVATNVVVDELNRRIGVRIFVGECGPAEAFGRGDDLAGDLLVSGNQFANSHPNICS